MSETNTDKFIRSFYKDPGDKAGIRPFRSNTRDHFHTFDKNLYGLVEFPSKVLLVAFQEVFAITDKWKYNDDPTKTNIYIADQYPDYATGEAEDPELRPAIITSRGSLTSANVNGRLHNRRVTPQQGEDGLVVFEQLLNCPMVIHCLAPRGPEAERIAALVFGMLVIDENIFKKRGVHALLNPEIGVEGPLEETSQLELVDVPVSCVMQFSWAWARRPDGGFVEEGLLDVDDTADLVQPDP